MQCLAYSETALGACMGGETRSGVDSLLAPAFLGYRLLCHVCGSGWPRGEQLMFIVL